MSERARQRRAFAARTGWGDAAQTALAGDASARRYERFTRDDGSAVLMDDPPPGHCVSAFVRIADLLRSMGYSAPRILDVDEALGFALLEDLGDDSFSALLAGPDASSLERTLYDAAIDFLIDLRGRSVPPDLPHYDPAWMLSDATLFLETAIDDAVEPAMAAEFQAAWREPLEEAIRGPAVLCLRDFHAGNLMWLPARGDGGCNSAGFGRVGLLDFQDARLGPAAYDLVSLLQDARRDVDSALENRLLNHYCIEVAKSEASFDEQVFRTMYAIMGAQRNTKILGIFARLAARDGKKSYLAHIPRVARYLQRNLAAAELANLRNWFETHLPEMGSGELIV